MRFLQSFKAVHVSKGRMFKGEKKQSSLQMHAYTSNRKIKI